MFNTAFAFDKKVKWLTSSILHEKGFPFSRTNLFHLPIRATKRGLIHYWKYSESKIHIPITDVLKRLLFFSALGNYFIYNYSEEGRAVLLGILVIFSALAVLRIFSLSRHGKKMSLMFGKELGNVVRNLPTILILLLSPVLVLLYLPLLTIQFSHLRFSTTYKLNSFLVTITAMYIFFGFSVFSLFNLACLLSAEIFIVLDSFVCRMPFIINDEFSGKDISDTYPFKRYSP